MEKMRAGRQSFRFDEIVNALEPDLGVSIHANSGASSGAEGWHTVEGFDDEGSAALAAHLSAGVAGVVGLADRGIFPETSNRHGGLYIHYWNAPSALIELGYMQADGQLLAERRRDFARGVAAWTPQTHGLRHENWLAESPVGLLNLPWAVAPGQIVPVSFTVTSPTTPGLHSESWSLYSNGEPIEEPVRLRLFVVPEEARELRDDVEAQIVEWRAQGEQEVERLLSDLTRQISEWLAREMAAQTGPVLWHDAAPRGDGAGRLADRAASGASLTSAPGSSDRWAAKSFMADGVPSGHPPVRSQY